MGEKTDIRKEEGEGGGRYGVSVNGPEAEMRSAKAQAERHPDWSAVIGR